MVERRPVITVLTHLVLILGVVIVAFPVYVTFVASTHTAQAIVQAPMPLIPGDQMLQNYSAVLIGTDAGAGSGGMGADSTRAGQRDSPAGAAYRWMANSTRQSSASTTLSWVTGSPSSPVTG